MDLSDTEFDLSEKRVPPTEELRAIHEAKKMKRTSTRRDSNIQDKKPKAAPVSKAGKKLAAEEAEARLPKELQQLTLVRETAEQVAMMGIKELIFQQTKGFVEIYACANKSQKKFLDDKIFTMIDRYNVIALRNTQNNMREAFAETI